MPGSMANTANAGANKAADSVADFNFMFVSIAKNEYSCGSSAGAAGKALSINSLTVVH